MKPDLKRLDKILLEGARRFPGAVRFLEEGGVQLSHRYTENGVILEARYGIKASEQRIRQWNQENLLQAINEEDGLVARLPLVLGEEEPEEETIQQGVVLFLENAVRLGMYALGRMDEYLSPEPKPAYPMRSEVKA